MITIYHAPRTRSVRPVWLLEEMGVPYAVESASLRDLPAKVREHNPGATIPLLVDGDTVLFESVVMLEYIAERYGPTPLALPPGHPDYWLYRELLVFGEATLAAPMNAVVGTRFMGPPEQQANFTVGIVRDAFTRRLGVVERRLERHPYVAGDAFTLADISVSYAAGLALGAPALGLADLIPPVVADYVRRLSERPAYQRMLAVK